MHCPIELSMAPKASCEPDHLMTRVNKNNKNTELAVPKVIKAKWLQLRGCAFTVNDKSK